MCVYQVLLIHSSMDIGCFHILDIMNNALVNMKVQKYLEPLILFLHFLWI